MPQLPLRSSGADPDADVRSAEPNGSSALELFSTLSRTGLHLDALQRECLSRHRLAFTEYSVLRLLQRAPDKQLAPSILADMIVCTTGAMTKLVDRLQRAHLVERAHDPVDRRRVLVQLTPAGERVADEASRSYQAGRARVLELLEEQEAEHIHRSLRRLLDVLETERSNS